MKKYCIVFVLLFIIIVAAAFAAPASGQEAYLRLHIRADSNAAADQAVKYEVKEAIVECLAPVAAGAESKEESMRAVEAALPAVEAAADAVLAREGFSYRARASLRREEFPTRVYGGKELKAGVYDALIVELGSGKGDNWWCVVYPPLCFAGEAGVGIQYRSRILEIIRSFFSD